MLLAAGLVCGLGYLALKGGTAGALIAMAASTAGAAVLAPVVLYGAYWLFKNRSQISLRPAAPAAR